MLNSFSTCETPPESLKKRTETLAKHIEECMDSGDGFVFGVLFDEGHCADIGGINGGHDDMIARLSNTFERLFVQQPDVADIIKKAMTIAIMSMLESPLDKNLNDNLTH